MAVNMNLRDIGTSAQYSAVTGKKRKSPYTSVLTASAASLREAARQKELDRIRQAELDQTTRQFNESQALDRESLAASEAQAANASKIQGVNTAITGTALANEAGIINLKDIAGNAGGVVKDAAGNIGSGVKSLLQTSAQKAAEEAAAKKVAETAAEAMAASEAGGAGGTSLGSVSELGGQTTVTAEQGAEAMLASEAGGAGGTAAGSVSGGGPTVGGAAGVLAIVAAADMLRKSKGNVSVPMEDRTNREKVFSTPVVSATPNAWFSDQMPDDSKMAKSTTASRSLEEGLIGRPLDLAFEGDFLGSLKAFGEGVKDAPGQVWDAVKNFATSTPTADLGRKIGGDAVGDVMEWANPVAVVGNLVGGKDGPCIIVTACTSADSPEVDIARAYRDRYLTPEQLRGYYIIAERVVPWIERSAIVKWIMKKVLVDNLIAYGRYELRWWRYWGKFGTMPPGLIAELVTKAFLARCQAVGSRRPSFTRCNGEIV